MRADEGLHLNKAADEARRRHLMRTSELRWRPVPVTRRRRRRAERFRLLDEPPFVTQNPAEEKAALAARVLANDTPTGRRRNMHELEGELAPDLPADRFGERFSLMALVTAKGNLKYNPAFGAKYDVKSQERGYKWAFWKVRAVRCVLAAVYVARAQVLARRIAAPRWRRWAAAAHRAPVAAAVRRMGCNQRMGCGGCICGSMGLLRGFCMPVRCRSAVPTSACTAGAAAAAAGAGARPGAQQRWCMRPTMN